MSFLIRRAGGQPPLETPRKRPRMEPDPTPSKTSKLADQRWRALPAHDPDRLHREVCKSADSCARCLWAENKINWMQRFPLDARHPDSGSWLMLGIDSVTKQPGIGCLVCKKFHMKGARNWNHCGLTGRKAKWSVMAKHAKSSCHLARWQPI